VDKLGIPFIPPHRTQFLDEIRGGFEQVRSRTSGTVTNSRRKKRSRSPKNGAWSSKFWCSIL